ncbi:hypothetical protein RND81_03G054600 [Saponaria officinalis]|uniref:DDHD domain-containing protein n=2 Tax=Saponaria officinalis TaxID=3572 RepID=A0AAW1M443_SAPOF
MSSEEASRITKDDDGGRSKEEASVSSNVDETNPDLLKNTPSNIQRLEDEIEQFEGRRKYLAHTTSKSDGGDVRWYFCKVPLSLNQLAASIPRAEIVGKGEYFRFGMRDSLAIEASFLQKEEELLSHWWKEYAECSVGPRVRTSFSIQSDLPQSSPKAEVFIVEEERVGVPVKGGLYEVDLAKRHCFPVYWNGENRRVLRGHWFAQSGGLDWLPLREDVAEQLEFAYRRQVWHRRTFQPSGLFAARVDLQGSTEGLHALFTGEDSTWEAWLNVDASGFSGIINLGGNGIKLRRGYAPSPSPKPTQDELRQQKEEEMDDYCSQVPVRHLVFMVHGIGQRLEKSNLVDDVTNFRHITSSLAEKHLTSYQRGIQRVLYIPCQWRKGLKFSGESAVEKITLDGVRGLRTTLSATVHDVLYYMSPIYCQEIIDSVSNQLNRLYLKFLRRNPGYDGKVSLYGHSLGSVLSYDILCHQENLSSPFPMDCLFRKHVKEEKLAGNISKVSFEPDSKVGEAKTMQGNSNEDVIGRQYVSSTLDIEGTKDCHPSVDICNSITSSIGEKHFTRETESKIEPHTSYDGQNQLCQSGDGTKLSGEVPGNNVDTRNYVEKSPSVDSAFQSDVSANVVEDKNMSHTEEDMDMIALKSKLEFMKGRVMELEAQLGRIAARGSDAVHPSISDQDESKKIQAGPDDSPMGYRPVIKYTKLEFKVDTFFAVGSPLGVFLAIRNVRIGVGEGGEYWGEENIIEEMPACQRMFNIFHPFDPVAYRIEPLVCKEYVSKRPVIVPYHRGGKRLHIGFQEFTEDLASRSQSFVNRLNSVRVQVLTVCQSRKQDSLEEAEEDTTDEKRSYGSYMMERLTGGEEERIDHVLQDKTFQHSYISAIGAHTNYWRDLDTALFMLNHLYRNIPEDPDQPKTTHTRNPKHDSVSTSWSDSKSLEEELPLTFYDSFTGNSPKKTKKNLIKSR